MKTKLTKFILWSIFLASLLVGTILVVFYVWTKQLVISEPKAETTRSNIVNVVEVENEVIAFPIGVNSLTKTITENPAVDLYVDSNLSIDSGNSRAGRFLDRILTEFVRFDWYQNLASSVSRILVIYPGERHEEVVKISVTFLNGALLKEICSLIILLSQNQFLVKENFILVGTLSPKTLHLRMWLIC